MGQYHIMACPEVGAGLRPHALGVGLKAVEQLGGSAMCSALAFMCATGLGDHPRDLPWARSGAWAGKAVLMIGDYAEDGDLVGRDEIFLVPEGKIYNLKPGKDLDASFRSRRGRTTLRYASAAFTPILERVAGLRLPTVDVHGRSADGGWRPVVAVAPDPDAPGGWKFDMAGIPEEDHADTLEFYRRCGLIDNPTWNRPPVRMEAADAPDLVPGADAGLGSRVLWVNLDRREFIDPERVGDAPDLAGVMTGLSTDAVLSMLFHPSPRGGGDLEPTGALSPVGRWRGDRIALIGEAGLVQKQTRVDVEEVLASFTDISDLACFIAHDVDIVGDFFSSIRDTRAREGSLDTLSPEGLEALRLAVKSPAAQARLESGAADLSVRFSPPALCPDRRGGAHLRLPPNLEIGIGYGRVWLEPGLRQRVDRVLNTIEPQALKFVAAGKSGVAVRDSIDFEIDLSALSAHQRIALLR